MAYTENEIYYPYDYDASADVPEDMKTMAESIDEVIGEIKGTQTTQNTRLSALETGQTSQSATIQALQAENTRLKKNQIYGTSTGTEVEITDGAEMGASIGVSGESEQETRSGKNILDANNPTGTNLATVGFNNNILTVSSTVTNTTPFARYEFPISYGDIVRLNAIILDTNGQIVTQVYNGTTWVTAGTLIKNYIDGSSISPITFESTEGYTAIRFLFYSNKGVPTAETSARYKNVIVTKNDSDMAYEQYGVMPSPEYPGEIKNLTGNTVCTITNANNQEKSVTFPLGAQKLAKGDYLASDGIHNLKNKNTINISAIVTLGNGNKGGVAYLTNKIYKSNNYLLCSKAIFDKERTQGEGTVYENESNVVIVGTSSDTLETLKEKYDGAIIEYELAEPTVTPYTTAQQTAWNELQSLILFEGYNHIEMTSPNGVKANLTVDYTKSTKIVIDDIEERLSVLEYAGLEG